MFKSLILSSALAATLVAAAPSDPHQLSKRQAIPAGMINLVNGIINPKGGKLTTGTLPKRVDMQVRVKAPGAKTVKLRYGPYKVPNMNSKNLMGEEGSLWNFGDLQVEKPCDECTVVGINAGLEYADGNNANINTGMWLHHMVLLNSGPGRSDPTCNFMPLSAPHMIAGNFPRSSERIFASGNERVRAQLENWGFDKVGYKVKKSDKFSMIVDLMNDTMDDKVVYLTMTYDYIPGHPADFSDVQPVWFDVAQCLTSEWPAPYNEGNYTIPSMTWKANVEGDIVAAIGHLHDGGQRVQLEVDGKTVCQSDASYGTSPEFVQKTTMHKGSATVHISDMTVCVNDKMGIKRMEKGQIWKLKAFYDYNKNKGVMHEEGKQSNVMGIAVMFIKKK